jgi:hypothetical protein
MLASLHLIENRQNILEIEIKLVLLSTKIV